jgi:hypothetical protein
MDFELVRCQRGQPWFPWNYGRSSASGRIGVNRFMHEPGLVVLNAVSPAGRILGSCAMRIGLLGRRAPTPVRVEAGRLVQRLRHHVNPVRPGDRRGLGQTVTYAKKPGSRRADRAPSSGRVRPRGSAVEQTDPRHLARLGITAADGGTSPRSPLRARRFSVCTSGHHGDGGNRTHVRNRVKGGVYERSRRSGLIPR